MKLLDARRRRTLDALLSRHREVDRGGGDRAVIKYARRFDSLAAPVDISRAEMVREADRTPREVRRAIQRSARHIARVSSRQVPKPFVTTVAKGVTIEQRIEPLARVGCYVPGGRFPLPSSLLMTAIPARVAGVHELIAVCARPEPAVMAAALEAGVTRLLRIGGAHAVAALAYGTETIPAVDKIVGPGSRYVAAAKDLVSADCAIDFHAGPSEIVVVASEGRPSWIAADLVAQAEHDPDARAIFITWKRAFAERVLTALTRRARGRDIVERSLRAHGAVVLVESAEAAMALVNTLAPEHLMVESAALIRKPVVAGAVFVGPYTAQAAGDYATGSNHVLPTSGAARFRGGLSAADFVRVFAVQRITRPGLAGLASTIVPLARAEGLRAHAESIEIRLR
jgi:histidinol dehydrogenase